MAEANEIYTQAAGTVQYYESGSVDSNGTPVSTIGTVNAEVIQGADQFQIADVTQITGGVRYKIIAPATGPGLGRVRFTTDTDPGPGDTPLSWEVEFQFYQAAAGFRTVLVSGPPAASAGGE